ncbi:MAG: VOC family protein [Chitinophagaceae bacterium]
MMEAIVPYLNFNGNASEALAFYAKAFDGKILFQQSFGESPMEAPAEQKDKIMHATFQAGNLTFMVSDAMPGQLVRGGTNTSLSLDFKTVADIQKTFSALSDGAIVTMPLQDTFWGARFGMLTDKFGINWMFNHDYEKKEK